MNTVLIERFKKHVAERPNDIFCIAGNRRLTFAEVDKLTDSIDSPYIMRCGDHVLGFTVPRDENMVLAPLAIAKAGYTAMPIDGSYPEERREFMKQDASKYEGGEAFVLLYTSGTTGVPKGVMLSDDNMTTFVSYHVKSIGLLPTSRYATYAGYGFDAYQMDLWSCVWAGSAIYIIGDDIRFDLAGMYEYIQKEKITHCFMTTQMATQMVLEYPDIPGLQWLGTGGEKLISLDPPHYTLANCYGPTETTVYVCHHNVDKNEENIPIGKPNDDVEFYIIDQQGKEVPDGGEGELIVAGPQVAMGYLNQPEKTAEVFVQWNGKRVYRTGDIVRRREDGNIEFVGRRDGQVKIRGFRIELKEVEAVIRQFPNIKDATVQAFDYPDGGKYIAAYIVSDEKIDIKALNDFILDSKPPYMLPTATMQIDSIPLNQNQKVNKRALPEPIINAPDEEEAEAAPLNMLEQELKAMIAEVVNTDHFGLTTDLRYAGLSSILSIKLATMIFKRFGVQIDALELIKGGCMQTIENEILRSMLEGSADATKNSAEPSSSDASASISRFPLSYAQMGVYIDSMKNPASTLYNTPICVKMPKEVKTEPLRQAVVKAVQNHPAMYVRFETDAEGVVQVIDEACGTFEIEERTMSEEEAQAFKYAFVQPFNLNKDRLFRFCIVRTEDATYLYCDLHHLICDGYSYDLFIHEVCSLLDGNPIEGEMCSYAQFVMEQKKAEDGNIFTEAETFFRQQLGEIEGVTEIDADIANPQSPGKNCKVSAEIEWEEATRLAQELGVTPAAVMLAAVFYSLARYAATDDVCMTTISNGRSNLKVMNTMGMFVNTLALTSRIGKQTVEEFIAESAKTFEDTLRHEDYPFAKIAADYNLKADIMFAYQIGVLSDYRVGGKQVKAEEVMELNVPKFKIAFYITDFDGAPSVAIEYDNGLYSEVMMQNLAQAVCNVVSAFAKDKTASLRSVSLLNSQQETVLDGFNNTEVEYDAEQTIVSLLARQVNETPDNIAVVYHDKRYTYREVDEISNGIAGYVQSLGLGQGDAVSILIPRCEWMVIASLGVLKAGCMYQPLDPSYPAERLNFMMKDAKAKLLIAEESLRSLVDEYQGEVLLIEQGRPRIVNSQSNQNNHISPSSSFILLYTSGSTGMPKGCRLTHGNLVAFCNWYRRYYDLKPGDKVAAYASYGFDACMMDMYPALTTGATVYIVGDDIRLNLPDLNDYFNAEGITHSFMTTQVGCQFAANCDNHSLRHLSVGGEKILPIVPPKNYRMHNAYGPTECTIFTTTYEMKEYEQNVPIGKPLDNLKLYVVDKELHRLPVGAAGELLVSGIQVGAEYINQPEKTAETFIKNPFETSGSKAFERCYRTGDIVRYLPDGNIQFVGRRDGQVKVRGFRIELKEVEAVIRQFPDISDATVQAFDYPNGGKYIAAYIVSDKKIDTGALAEFIRGQKPAYMVPAATMQIDSIPLNQNQKVNRRALPTPQLQLEDRDYVAPKGEVETLFCNIFAQILNVERVSATDNFFEMGGTSLMVTRVVIEADKMQYHVAYGDVFTHPTPSLLAQYVGGESSVEDTADSEAAEYDYTGIDAILQHNNIETFKKGERQQLGDVLLTGATGYLGIHVLYELINSDAKTITCLVRNNTQQEAERRLKTLLYYYFAKSFDPLFGSRIFVVNGDVTQDFDDLAINHQPSTIFNCAANVKHFSKTTDIEDVNVGGAKNCIKYCMINGARLVHISTTSTGEIWIDRGDGSPVPKLDERKLYFGQFLDNRYVHSKFLAERLILDAVAHHGLNAKIMRVGNLAARSYDGEFQANFRSNSYMGRLRIFNMLGCCPFDEYDAPTEMSPIDETARAVVLLASTPKECNLFQPFNNHTELQGDVLKMLEDVGSSIRFVEQEEFLNRIKEVGSDPDKASLMSAMLAYEDMAHGMKTVTIERDNRYTCAVLHRLGFKWSDTSKEYIEQMLRQIASFGFFEE